jgi:ubiquinol-cytochrome c reductase iron-sulfur subunit
MAAQDSEATHDSASRRDILVVASGAFAAVGGAMAIWPFIDQMNPAADVLALASIEVNIGDVPVGQSIKVKWRGKPVFIRHRSEEEIREAESAPMSALKDPEADDARVKKPEWLIVIGICTHLGCVPLNYAGEYDGWFCPCHGSVYDTSGRIRKGPAPANLVVPPYEFVSDTTVKIG